MQILRRTVIGLSTIFLAMNGACTADGKVSNGPLDLCSFEMVFSDDFNDLSISPRKLDGKRWTAHTPWNGDFGDANFSDPHPGWPFRVEDGKLLITAQRDEKGRWRSGLIAAADASGKGHGVQYGYFEARMKLPPGPGTWPAFWLISLKPVKDRAPKIEIDVIEYYGHRTDAYHVTGHVWYRGPDKKLNRHEGAKVAVEPDSLVNAFHTYGVRVDPENITYYFDRKAVWQQSTPSEHKTPLYPLVNLALGSGYSIKDTPDPSVLEVDYVHVYRPTANNVTQRCN